MGQLSRERCPRGTRRSPVVFSLTLAQRALRGWTVISRVLVGTIMEFNEINEPCYNSTKRKKKKKKKKKRKSKAMTAENLAETIGNSSTMAWFPYEQNLWNINHAEDHFVTKAAADFANTSHKCIHSEAMSKMFRKDCLNLQMNSKALYTTSVTTDDNRKTWREDSWQSSSSGYQPGQARETNARRLKWDLRSAGSVPKQPQNRSQADDHSPAQPTSRTIIYNDKATDKTKDPGNQQVSSNNQSLQAMKSNGRGIVRSRSPNESIPTQPSAKKNKIYPAPTDIKAAITGGRLMSIVPATYPEISLTFKQAQKIEQALCEALDNIPEDRPVPQFEGWRYEEGAISITCKDDAAKTWLRETVADIKPWEGASFAVYNELPKLKRMATSIRGSIVETEVILQRLKRQNPGLRTHLWKVFKRKEGIEVIHLVLGVDVLSYEKLKEANFVAFVGLKRALFRETQPGGPELHNTGRIDQTVAANNSDGPSGMANTTEVPKMLQTDVIDETESGTIAGVVAKVKPELIETSIKSVKIIRVSQGLEEDKTSEMVTEDEAKLSEMEVEPDKMIEMVEMPRPVEPDTLVETVVTVKVEMAETDKMSKTVKPESIIETVIKVKPELVETAIVSVTTAESIRMATTDGTTEVSKTFQPNTTCESVTKAESKLEKTVVGFTEASETTKESTAVHEVDSVAETTAEVGQQLDETAVGLIGAVESIKMTQTTDESTAPETYNS